MPTISGSVGRAGAGATIVVAGNCTGGPNANENPQACASVVADANGNYTTPNVVANDVNTPSYFVYPVLFGAEFSPIKQSVVVAASNITGVNWTGPSSYYAFTPVFSDTFNRADQNPVVGWTTFTGDNALQLASHALEATSNVSVSGAFPTAYTEPADCYIQVRLVAMNVNDLTAMRLRESTVAGTQGYVLEIAGGLGVANTATWQLNDGVTGNAFLSSLGSLQGASVTTYNVGDVITLMVRGNNTYCFLTPVNTTSMNPLAAGSSTNTPSAAKSGIEIFPAGALNLTTYNNFVAGTVIAASAPGIGNSSWLTTNLNNSLRGLRH